MNSDSGLLFIDYFLIVMILSGIVCLCVCCIRSLNENLEGPYSPNKFEESMELKETRKKTLDNITPPGKRNKKHKQKKVNQTDITNSEETIPEFEIETNPRKNQMSRK